MKIKQFFTDLKDYLMSVYFWRTVVGLIIFIAIVLFGVSFYLKIYTRHGQTILTPELRGLTVEQARQVVARKHLRLKVIDSIYQGVGAPGTIVDQTPPTNFHVKKGRTIFVTVKAVSPRMVTLPNLTEISFIQAQYDLQRLGLKVGNVIYKPTANFDNLVLAVLYKGDTLRPGDKLPQGTAVDLIVAKRNSEQAVALDSLQADSTQDQIPIEF